MRKPATFDWRRSYTRWLSTCWCWWIGWCSHCSSPYMIGGTRCKTEGEKWSRAPGETFSLRYWLWVWLEGSKPSKVTSVTRVFHSNFPLSCHELVGLRKTTNQCSRTKKNWWANTTSKLKNRHHLRKKMKNRHHLRHNLEIDTTYGLLDHFWEETPLTDET